MKLEYKNNITYTPNDEVVDFIKMKLLKHNKTLNDIASENNMSISGVNKYLYDKNRCFTSAKFNEIFKSLDIYIDDRTKTLKERRNKNKC